MEILRLVWVRELSAGEIAACFEVTFGAISQHLTVLREAGLIRQRRDGRRRLYTADRTRLGPIAGALEAMWAERTTHLKMLAEADEIAIPRRRAPRARRTDDTRIHEPHDRTRDR